jgi:hypothetical protein
LVAGVVGVDDVLCERLSAGCCGARRDGAAFDGSGAEERSGATVDSSFSDDDDDDDDDDDVDDESDAEPSIGESLAFDVARLGCVRRDVIAERVLVVAAVVVDNRFVVVRGGGERERLLRRRRRAVLSEFGGAGTRKCADERVSTSSLSSFDNTVCCLLSSATIDALELSTTHDTG